MAYNILVVDDEPNIVLSLEYLMKQEGFTVFTADNGDDALTAVTVNKPDLILLDIMIPLKDGYEVCQSIRMNPDCKDVKIIMLTAKGRAVDREKGLALGADEYITKPFSTREVVNKVKDMLKEKD